MSSLINVGCHLTLYSCHSAIFEQKYYFGDHLIQAEWTVDISHVSTHCQAVFCYPLIMKVRPPLQMGMANDY